MITASLGSVESLCRAECQNAELHIADGAQGFLVVAGVDARQENRTRSWHGVNHSWPMVPFVRLLSGIRQCKCTGRQVHVHELRLPQRGAGNVLRNARQHHGAGRGLLHLCWLHSVGASCSDGSVRKLSRDVVSAHVPRFKAPGTCQLF